MSWSLQHRDEGWFVIREADGSSEGCHDSRVDAIKHQRALYAQESRVASMYADLDARPDPEPNVASVSMQGLSPLAAEAIGMLLKVEREQSMVASISESQSLMAQQMQEAQQDRQALVAALGRMGSPTINVPSPEVNVHVPQAQVDVHVPAAEVTVNVPDVTVNVPAAQITVQPADVNVTLPERSKTVTFERDPLTHQVTKAEVTET